MVGILYHKGKKSTWRRQARPVRSLKSAKQIERHIKGIANHWRINILMLVADNPGISLDQIVERLSGNYNTIGEHVRRLSTAGLIEKKYRGHEMGHTLSPYGKTFHVFLISFSNS